MTCLLTENFPSCVDVDGVKYEVYTDFKDWIKFHCMLDDETLTDRDKTAVALSFYKSDIPKDIQKAYIAIAEFAAGTAIPQAGRQHKEDRAVQASKPACFSFIYDAPLILSAFMQVYGIDIQSGCHMHWYKFLCLFQGLPDDTPIKQRIQLRLTNTAEIKDRKQRMQILKAQAAVALPHRELQENDIDNAFCSGFFADSGGG